MMRVFLMLLLFSESIFAAPDLSKYTFESKFLAEYSIFKIDIQYISLFTSKRYESPKELILEGDQKAIKIEYLRSLSRKILLQAWDESFETVLDKEELEKYKEKIDQIDKVTRDVKSGDIVTVEFDDSGFDYYFNNKKLTRVEGSEFSRKTLGIWVGGKAVDEDMKNGMLKNNLKSL